MACRHLDFKCTQHKFRQINVTAVQKGLGKVRIREVILGKRRQCFWQDTNCWNHLTASNIWEYLCTNPKRTGHNYVKILGSEEIMGRIWEDNDKVVSECKIISPFIP